MNASNEINQLFSDFNKNINQVLQKEIIEYQKTISELKEENIRKTHNIDELNNRIKQIITIKDLIINNFKRDDAKYENDIKSNHALIQKLQCTVFDQTIKIEELEEKNKILLQQKTELLLDGKFHKYYMDSNKGFLQQDVEKEELYS